MSDRELGWHAAPDPWSSPAEAELWADAHETRPSPVEAITAALAHDRGEGADDE